LKHSHPPVLCIRYSRWRARVHTPVLPCLAHVLPHSSHPWRAFLISSLFRDLAWDSCLANHLRAPGLVLMDCDSKVPAQRLSLKYPQYVYTVPLAEPLVMRDLGCCRPSRTGRLPRPSRARWHPLLLPKTLVTGHDVDCRAHPNDTGPGFFDGVHQIRGRRPTAAPDGLRHDAKRL
jgi:hypothetical protein